MTRANLSRPVVEVLQQRASSGELPRGRPLNAPAGRSGPGVPLQSPEGVEVSLVVRGIQWRNTDAVAPRHMLFHQHHLPRLREISLAGQPAQIHPGCKARSVPGHGMPAGAGVAFAHGGDVLAVHGINGQVDALGLSQGEGDRGDWIEGVGVIESEPRLGWRDPVALV